MVPARADKRHVERERHRDGVVRTRVRGALVHRPPRITSRRGGEECGPSNEERRDLVRRVEFRVGTHPSAALSRHDGIRRRNLRQTRRRERDVGRILRQFLVVKREREGVQLRGVHLRSQVQHKRFRCLIPRARRSKHTRRRCDSGVWNHLRRASKKVCERQHRVPGVAVRRARLAQHERHGRLQLHSDGVGAARPRGALAGRFDGPVQHRNVESVRKITRNSHHAQRRHRHRH
mmetsp:Transcript_38272/g.101577  ORF Transcript_38272/g.101577 Transcript_38272/m.101577 type:complete len:234 (+) Transcript_38272:768-1469(+)